MTTLLLLRAFQRLVTAVAISRMLLGASLLGLRPLAVDVVLPLLLATIFVAAMFRLVGGMRMRPMSVRASIAVPIGP